MRKYLLTIRGEDGKYGYVEQYGQSKDHVWVQAVAKYGRERVGTVYPDDKAGLERMRLKAKGIERLTK